MTPNGRCSSISRASLLGLLVALSPLPAAAQPPPPLPPPPPPSPPPPATASDAAKIAGYHKGFFISSPDGKFTLQPGAMVQARFTYENVEDGDDQLFFQLRRTRLVLAGHAFTPALGYKLQFAWDKGDLPVVKDAYADYALHKRWLYVRAGQYKKPFSRQLITSGGKQAFVDRSITDKAFGSGRDIGVMLHDNYEKSPTFEYAVGVFNGTGDKPSCDPEKFSCSTTPEKFHPLGVVRVGYNHGKLAGYSEVDFEGGAPRFGVAGSTQIQWDAENDNEAFVSTGFDYVVKLYGFASTGGFYLLHTTEEGGVDLKDLELGAIGFHLQAGYLVAKMFEPGVRYARVIPKGSNNDTQEIAGVLGIYPYKHNFKVQLDGAALTDQSKDSTDVVVRTQLQLAF